MRKYYNGLGLLPGSRQTENSQTTSAIKGEIATHPQANKMKHELAMFTPTNKQSVWIRMIKE